MEQKGNELHVGIVVLLALVILIGGIIWGKGYRLDASRYSISVIFENIGGLEPGSNVLANGVIKGRVTGVEMHHGLVTVHASVDDDITLYQDCWITIESPTLMAGKVLAIYPGRQEPPLEITQNLVGHQPLGVGEALYTFQELADALKVTLANVNTLLVSIHEVVGDTANQANLEKLLDNSAGFAESSNELLQDNRARFNVLLTDLEETIASARRLTTQTENRLGATMYRVDSAAVEITELSSSIRELIEKLKSEDNTVGRLIADDELYVRANRAIAELDSLAHDLRTKGLRHRIVLF